MLQLCGENELCFIITQCMLFVCALSLRIWVCTGTPLKCWDLSTLPMASASYDGMLGRHNCTTNVFLRAILHFERDIGVDAG